MSLAEELAARGITIDDIGKPIERAIDWDKVAATPPDPEAAEKVISERAQEKQAKLEAFHVSDLRARKRAQRIVAAEEAAEAAAQHRLRVVEGVDFLYGDDADEPAIWGDHRTGWASGESLMVFGPPGVGKSTLAHQLILGRLGIINKVLGMPVHDDGGRVFYVAADRPKQIRRAMRRLARPEHREAFGRLTLHEGPLPLDVTTGKDALADLAQQHGATTIVVDSVKDLCSDPRSGTLANGYNLARQEALARGVEWLELHHGRKANGENKKPTGLDDVYGDRWLTAGAGSVLCVWGEAGDRVVELTQVKTPAGHIQPCRMAINFATGGVELADTVAVTTPLEVLRVGHVDGMTAMQVAVALDRAEKSTRIALDRLANKGQCEKYRHPVTLNVLYRPNRDIEPVDHGQREPLFDLDPGTNT